MSTPETTLDCLCLSYVMELERMACYGLIFLVAANKNARDLIVKHINSYGPK